MTSAFLQSELASLIQDSKRKQADVRGAAERSLNELRSISVTSETQLAGDLLRKSQFIDPFVLACHTKLAKLALTGAVCLQRLVASRAVPRGRLSDVLDAFQEASNQGLDVQLKILQALPSLLQLYASELHGEPLAKVLSLCVGLAASKTGMVSSTAAATFQQLVTSVFERITQQDSMSQNKSEADQMVVIDDATKVFVDMCLAIRLERLQFLQVPSISLTLALEVVESCLANEDLNILSLDECVSSCTTSLIPGIAVLIEESNNYTVFGQCLRIAYLLLADPILNIVEGIAETLHAVMEWLDRGNAGAWKRILCLEFMKDVCTDFEILRFIYTTFDRRAGQRRLIQDFMSILVRVAAEDPSLIGLGRQSTIPTNTAESDIDAFSTSVEIQDLGAIGSVTQANSNVTGLSMKWSTVNTLLYKQADRRTAPEIPETYVFTLVLECVASFSDGLSKFIMPLSVPARTMPKTIDHEGTDESLDTQERKGTQRMQKYQRLMNPLRRDDLANIDEIKISAAMVEDCWPAVLATCSTFLSSALDSHFYHILVRTVQKLAQVSGVLDLLTPRDALLTSLAKVSVPINTTAIILAVHGNRLAKNTMQDTDMENDLELLRSPTQPTSRPSIDASRQSLNVRNLLCLRALLNLGIALGPTLSETSWLIILQTLQQVNALMSIGPGVKSTPNTPNPQASEHDGQTSLSSEISAVGTAAKRMIESTRTYTDTAFKTFTLSIFNMISDLALSPSKGAHDSNDAIEKASTLNIRGASHRPARSVSGVLVPSSVLKIEAEFVFKTVSDLARINLHRFAMPDSKAVSWDLIVAQLLLVLSHTDVDPALRLQAASTVDLIAMEVIKLLERSRIEPLYLDILQQECLQTISRQLGLIYHEGVHSQDVLLAEIEVHRRVLEAIENIVSHSGESLKRGWQIVFATLQQTLKRNNLENTTIVLTGKEQNNDEVLSRIVAPAFRIVQLIVSDFLGSIDSESLWVLIQLLPLFGLQNNEVNISLTTATLFWNVHGLILDRSEVLDVSENLSTVSSPIENPDSIIAAETSTLWFATMMHLAELCGDIRPDVRNGSMRVLLRMFEASSEKLTPAMWNLSIRKVLLSTLTTYSKAQSDIHEWHTSFSHLLAGTNSLLLQNREVIIRPEHFLETWTDLMHVYHNMLRQHTSDGHNAVFISTSAALQALALVQIESQDLVLPILQIWLEFHPADLGLDGVPNSKEFSLHAQVLSEIQSCSSDALRNFSSRNDSLHKMIMKSIQRTILEALHGRYVNDIKKMSPEQEAAVSNLILLRDLMLDAKHEFAQFLIGLIQSTLAVQTAKLPSNAGPDTTGLQKPKLVAFMMRCISLLEEGIPVTSTGNQWLTESAASSILMILAKVIATKYAPNAQNDVLPPWKKATTIAVSILEAINTHTSPVSNADIVSIAPAILPVVHAILNAPALDKQSLPAAEVLQADETFDVDHAERLHTAIRSLLTRPEFPAGHRKEYTAMLLQASLLAKPWFGDLPSDLADDPLQEFDTIRSGSIRLPEFCLRQKIPYQALKSLFDLTKASVQAGEENLLLAKSAAPFLLLRILYTIKTFLADQRLRYLTPPPRRSQEELNIVLSKCLDLHCYDEAFDTYSTRHDGLKDGKTHLRILQTWVLELKDVWDKLPRLRVCAWQDDHDGRAVEAALKRWNLELAGGFAYQA